MIDVVDCRRGKYTGVELIMEDGTKRAKIFGEIKLIKEVAVDCELYKNVNMLEVSMD